MVAGYLLARNLGYFGGSASFNLANVAGQPVAQATTTLEADGLTVKRSSQVSTDTAGTGGLDRSRPRFAGQEGRHRHPRCGRSRPLKKVSVPSGIVGEPLAQAKSLLQAQGLQETVAYKPETMSPPAT